jgi:hypothetical protein
VRISPQSAGASHPAQAEPARTPPAKRDASVRVGVAPKRDYYARLSARFLKDPLISPDAKLLRALLAAFADERTHRTFVSPRRLDTLLRCAHKYRERLQRELVAAGWLRLERERQHDGRLGRRIYVLCEPPLSFQPPRPCPSPKSFPPSKTRQSPMPPPATSGPQGPSKESMPSKRQV